MRTTEKRVKTTEETVAVKITCDLCGVVGSGFRPGGISLEAEWPGGDNDESYETVLSMTRRRSERHERGGGTAETWVDICPECFKGKLMPWLYSQGVAIPTKKTDW